MYLIYKTLMDIDLPEIKLVCISTSVIIINCEVYMFVWKSGFQNSLIHTVFNMFVDEWTSANESPVKHRLIVHWVNNSED